MSIRGKILTPGMLVIAMAIAVAGISAAYAMLRTTSEVPAQLVAVEATYQLGIYDTDLIPLSLLDFREVVAGNPTHASLRVENEGNTATRLGFRVRYGD